MTVSPVLSFKVRLFQRKELPALFLPRSERLALTSDQQYLKNNQNLLEAKHQLSFHIVCECCGIDLSE